MKWVTGKNAYKLKFMRCIISEMVYIFMIIKTGVMKSGMEIRKSLLRFVGFFGFSSWSYWNEMVIYSSFINFRGQSFEKFMIQEFCCVLWRFVVKLPFFLIVVFRDVRILISNSPGSLTSVFLLKVKVL